MTRSYDRLVVIGASAGGVHALLEIAAGLPQSFAAPICVVQHIGSNPSLLPDLVRYRGPNDAVHVEDGQRLAPGTIHIAPPDRHILVEGDRLRLTHGPKENHARPAIDPLFRSAAVSHGPHAIGIVLTGHMDDGTAGLRAIKDCGGIAIVQDPDTAAEGEMPRSALQNVAVDHCVPLHEMASLLLRLVGAPEARARPPVPVEVVREVSINLGMATMDELLQIAAPSPLTCPDCGGGLWEMKQTKPLRYRCHTGHAYSAVSLSRAQRDTAEHALWSSVRALREREILLRRMAAVSAAIGEAAQAAAAASEAERIGGQARTLQEFAESTPATFEADAAA